MSDYTRAQDHALRWAECAEEARSALEKARREQGPTGSHFPSAAVILREAELREARELAMMWASVAEALRPRK